MDSMNENENSKLIFVINQKVRTKESYIPTFSPALFIADLGGSLGLWLGVGVVQIFGGLYKILLCAKNKREG